MGDKSLKFSMSLSLRRLIECMLTLCRAGSCERSHVNPYLPSSCRFNGGRRIEAALGFFMLCCPGLDLVPVHAWRP